MKKKNLLLIIAVLSLGFSLQGCLAVETKEYTFKLNKDLQSGKGTIKFINIMSDVKDSTSSTEADYKELVESYLNGEKLNEELQGAKNIKKRLFEEDNQLCGEITFDFDDITKMKFYKYKETGPWCLFLGFTPMGIMGGSETYFSSNGTYGGDKMPVIFWDRDVREFKYKTTLTQPAKTTVSLVDEWKKSGGK